MSATYALKMHICEENKNASIDWHQDGETYGAMVKKVKKMTKMNKSNKWSLTVSVEFCITKDVNRMSYAIVYICMLK